MVAGEVSQRTFHPAPWTRPALNAALPLLWVSEGSTPRPIPFRPGNAQRQGERDERTAPDRRDKGSDDATHYNPRHASLPRAPPPPYHARGGGAGNAACSRT